MRSAPVRYLGSVILVAGCPGTRTACVAAAVAAGPAVIPLSDTCVAGVRAGIAVVGRGRMLQRLLFLLAVKRCSTCRSVQGTAQVRRVVFPLPGDQRFVRIGTKIAAQSGKDAHGTILADTCLAGDR